MRIEWRPHDDRLKIDVTSLRRLPTASVDPDCGGPVLAARPRHGEVEPLSWRSFSAPSTATAEPPRNQLFCLNGGRKLWSRFQHISSGNDPRRQTDRGEDASPAGETTPDQMSSSAAVMCS